ncbi:MAG: hypothetical protein GC179_13385 [Anaerolineaceae bacterium]|nr:hypothetical protein [Anaerolineaceae bacterium]
MRKLDARKLAREKNLFRYSSALERADFATVEAVLREAERDPLLAQMITEINAVYESETLRLSPSLNHSSNHHQKELLMTTIILPRRQNTMQRWLPITLAAACVSVLFIGALLMRPTRPGGSLAAIQTGSTSTPTAAASPTPIPTSVPTFTSTPMAIAESSALTPTIVPPDMQSSAGVVGTQVCGGTKIITEDTLVHAQPSNQSVAIGSIAAGTKAETLATGFAAEGDTSLPQTQWFFIKADVNGNSVQGWVSANIAQPVDPANPCPANLVVVGSTISTPVPINALPSVGTLPTIVPPDVMVVITPSDLTTAAQASTSDPAKTVPIGACDLTNETNKPITIFAAPLSANSSAGVVGQLRPNAQALVLYQNYDIQSAPIGGLWYLIITIAPGDQQVTGWVSVSSLMTTKPCPSAPVITSKDQFQVVTGSAQPVVTPSQMCLVTNSTGSAITIFAAPLTADSNAPVVGKFTAGSSATIILENDDRQSASIGAQWFLIKVEGEKVEPIIGWVSANDLNRSKVCINEAAGLSSSDPASGQVQTAVVPATAASDSVLAATCTVTVQQNESVPVFSGPSSKENESLLVNNLPPNMPAAILYQQQNQETGITWYLVLAASKEGKQVSGWVSSESVKLDSANCPK